MKNFCQYSVEEFGCGYILDESVGIMILTVL